MNLTDLIARLQTQLIDDGARFSTPTCTAAIRSALSKLNARIPVHAATRIDVVPGQHEYEVSDEDPRAVGVIDVLEWQSDERHVPLRFDCYTEDERWFVRLRSALRAGEILCRYLLHHTVSGLDAEVETTLSDDLLQILIDGASAEALAIRAAARVETINLQQGVSENYRRSIEHFQLAFENGIAAYLNRRAPVSQPRKDSWYDYA